MSFIGVFDSGLGGLSVLKHLHQQFPHEEFVYLADSQNIPYGEKNTAQLKEIFNHNINCFKKAKGIVVACSTISSLIPEISPPKKPVYSIIDSLVQTYTQEFSDIKNIGILATSFTVEHGAYLNAFNQANFSANITQIAAPLLVPAIENNADNIVEILDQYIAQFPNNIKHLILGCTHYNLLLEKFQQNYKNLTIINPYSGIIQQVSSIISKEKTDIIKPLVFLTTKYSENLQKISEEIMQQDIIWESISL